MHNIGHLRYLECSHLGEGSAPEGDLALWKEVYFPYDPELRDRKNLSRTPVRMRPDLFSQEVVETYEYNAQGGMIQVCIENQTAGYRKTFSIGLGVTTAG